MKKKRIMAAGLAVIMAFTGTGCQKILKGEPAETTSKESQEADAATKESVNESESGAEESESGPETEENAESKKTNDGTDVTSLYPYRQCKWICRQCRWQRSGKLQSENRGTCVKR